MPEIAAPTKEGYVFEGFFDGENGAGTQYYDANGASARNWDKNAETATLYAKWGPEWQTLSLAEAIAFLNEADKAADIAIKIVDDEATDLGNAWNSGTLGNAVNGYTSKSGKVSLDLTGMTKLTDIGNYAFYECKSFASIDIPDGVTSIGKSAFWGCSSLASIDIPDSVTSIGSDAFSICPSLADIVFEGNEPPSFGTGVFSSNKSTAKIYVPDGAEEAYRKAENFTKYADRIKPISERP